MKYPYQVFLGVTYKCNLNCKHCYVHKKLSQDVPIDQIKKLLDTLAHNGVIKLVFTHGESLIRDDFEEIIEYASEKGFYLTLLSNGVLLTEDKAKRLVSKGLNKIQISLDSLDSSYHNQLRGRPLAWEKALEGIDNSIKSGLKVGINTTINRHNYKELEDYIKFAIERGLEEIDLLMIRPSSEGSQDEYNFTNLEYKEIVNEIWSYKQKYKNKIIVGFHDPLAIHILSPKISNKIVYKQMVDENICQAGKLWVSILPNGEVQPCNFLPVSCGNAYEENFDSILKNIRTYIKKEFVKPIKCETCEFGNLCNGGCKGFSVSSENKLDPRCNYLLLKS